MVEIATSVTFPVICLIIFQMSFPAGITARVTQMSRPGHW